MAGAAKAPFLVVNTDGLVHDAGRPFRELLVDLLRPDAIVAIRRGDDLDPLLAELAHRPVLALKRSRRAWGRPTVDRQEHRARLFFRYFQDAPAVALDARRLVFQRVPDGDPYLGGAPLPACLTPDRLLGMCDRSGRCLGLARVEAVEPAAGTLTVRTPTATTDDVRVVQVGRIGVRGDGWEVG